MRRPGQIPGSAQGAPAAKRPSDVADIQIKRVYEPRRRADGQRVLVDRVWPRGISKEKLGSAIWLKEIAPSTALRTWFGHRPERWDEFRDRYAAELDRNKESVGELRALCAKGTVTLLYSARDEAHNQARALAEYLRGKKN
jgi:uncharacterized protein YeaO (DUF488 family)